MRPTDVALAYDAIASTYDEQVRGDEWMRQVLWQSFQGTFQPGDRVLDVGCGTGRDAIFLAQNGIQVVGIDASPKMIEQLSLKTTDNHLAGRVEARVMDFSELGILPAADFDGIISSFAGLNVVPDLVPFAADASRLLRPGGRMILHLLGRFSVWEWLGLIAHRQWRAARELGTTEERTFPIGGHPVRHFLHQSDDAYRRFFAAYFWRQRTYSLGCLRPPHTSRRVPSPWIAGLGRVERQVASAYPFVNWGRFFVLELRRRDRPGAAMQEGRG
jgi:SAM-dependent methyltransferase